MSTTPTTKSLYPFGFTRQFAFLSNFAPSVIEYQGLMFPTVEHAFQAAKTTDIETRQRIAQIHTPGEAKRAGRSLVLRPEWERIKVGVMLDLLRRKFVAHQLAAQLCDTEDYELVEWNAWHDNTWGVCICTGSGTAHCPTCRTCTPDHIARGFHDGLNLLGHLLTIVRQEILDAPEKVFA